VSGAVIVTGNLDEDVKKLFFKGANLHSKARCRDYELPFIQRQRALAKQLKISQQPFWKSNRKRLPYRKKKDWYLKKIPDPL